MPHARLKNANAVPIQQVRSAFGLPGALERHAMRSVRMLVALAATTAAVAAVAPGGAAAGTTVRDVPGTQLVATTIQTQWGTSQAWYDRIDLTNARLHIEPVLDGNLLDASHETVPSMARRTHAIVGINGDFWNWQYDPAGPLRGLWIHGHMLKTPGYRTSANFYTTNDGKAHIGPVHVYTTLSWRSAGRLRQASVFSVNNVYDMYRRFLVMTTSDLAAVPLPGCNVAFLNSTTRGWKVARTATRVRLLGRRLPTQRALVACGFRTPLAAGELVHSSQSVTVRGIDALVSGDGQLIRNGRAFRDPATQLPTDWVNPMTFACVARDARHVIFGVVDGRRPTSVGITPAQLTNYLLHLGGCWNAMSFDGGGSTTLWARGRVQNVPSDGQPRPVVDGLFVYRS